MNLVVDSGNTLTKTGLFKNKVLVKVIIRKFNEKSLFNNILAHNPKKIILSSVGNNLNVVFSKLCKKIPALIMNPTMKLPFKNLYKTKKTLGNDRLALAAGAVTLYPKKNCLIICAGTCITYNFITSDTKFTGGAISPGMRMRFKMLHSETGRLPLLKNLRKPKLIGKTTGESILSGVINGVSEEITGVIKRYRATYPGVKIIFCGGDSEFLHTFIKIPVIVAPNLGLYGLNRILEENG